MLFDTDKWYNSLDWFREAVSSKDGIWATDKVRFTQNGKVFTAYYEPEYPNHSAEDQMLCYNTETNMWEHREPFALDDDAAAMVRKDICSFCYAAEDGTYTMEYFVSPDGKAEVTLSAGNEMMQFNVEFADGHSGLITTAARCCPYCGRRFRKKDDE